MDSILKHAVWEVAESFTLCLFLGVILLQRLVKSDYLDSCLFFFVVVGQKVSSLASVISFIGLFNII